MRTCGHCGKQLPLSQFFKRGDRPNGLRSWCKDCHRTSVKKWEQQNPTAAAEAHKFKNILAKYGITREVYEEFLAKQEGRCAGCAKEFVGVIGPKSPCVDHDHETGDVRGLLCRHCNFALGLLDDNPAVLRHLITYLEASQ